MSAQMTIGCDEPLGEGDDMHDHDHPTALRRTREERGQTLVEYALIIAVVSLGSLAALGFLSGKIQTLFSKAGSSISNVTVASGSGSGSGSGTGGGTPPANNTTVTGTGIPSGGGGSQWFGPGTMTSGPPGLTGQQGVYTNSTPSSSTCTFTLNGFTYTGVWLREADNSDWDGSGVSGDYEFACIASPSFTPPSNGTDMEGTTLSGNSDGAEYFAAGAGVGINNPSPSPSPAGAWDDDQGGSGTWFYYPDGGGGSGVLICTWHSVTPGNAAYDFPGNSNTYDEYCN